MVISHIIGGLGNQLFQYAAGRAIAEKYNVDFKLDLTDINEYKLWAFDLDKLNTGFEIAANNEIERLKPQSNISKGFQYLKPKNKRTYHRERFFHFAPSFDLIGPKVYLKGYFQSWKYFYSIENIIRKEFVIKNEFIKNVTGFSDELKNIETASIHIRRGDYTNKEVLKRHGILGIDYYQKAINMIISKKPEVLFCLFSDDIDWVKSNLKIENSKIISGAISKTHLEDLFLMSQCKNNIIANSSFSWWGAWLNNNPDKIVVGPKKWFDQGPKDTFDILPSEWITI